MKKILSILVLIILFPMNQALASNTWCSGKVSNVKLNTDYNNDTVSFTVNGVVAELSPSQWSVDMRKSVLSLMISAQLSGKSVSYWGSADCKTILNRLSLTDS